MRLLVNSLETLIWIFQRIWLLVLLAVMWLIGSRGSVSPFFPPLDEILNAFSDVWFTSEGWHHVSSSLTNFLIGYGFSLVAGVVLGIVLWRLPALNDSMTWLLYFLYVIPTAALLPALVTILGIGMGLKVAVVVLASIWPTLLNTIDGMRSIDQVKLDTADVVHMSEFRRIWSVALPNALPQIVAGARHSLQISVIMIVVSEMTASTSGVGFKILESQHTFALTEMWTGILMLGVLGLLASLIFSGFEKWILGWYRGFKGAKV